MSLSPKTLNHLWHLAAITLIVGLLSFSANRARDPYHWSQWDFGDAQTMLTLKHWDSEGWLNNYLLFIPQGHARVVRSFDDERLRHHAHGICPLSSPGVGPRLWYTHYPSGYLIPYAALYGMGLHDIWDMRMLSIAFSALGLYLMYLALARIAEPAVALAAAVYYGLSSAFLQYNDSLANQPLDDMLRFALMYAVVRATGEPRRRWFALIWALGFTLSLSSLDSVFFAFVWLVGWDMASAQGFRWRRYILYGIAPTLAHGLQIAQNAWYLGWPGAMKDIEVTFLTINKTAQAGMGSGVLVTFLSNAAATLHVNAPAFALMLAAYAAYALWADRAEGRRMLIVLGALLVGGVAYVAVFKNGALMSYQGRQLAPFIAFAVGLSTVALIKAARGARGMAWGGVAACAVLLGVVWWSYASASRQGYAIAPEVREEFEFARRLAGMKTEQEPVYFNLYGFNDYYNMNYVPGYPQIAPQIEYYAASSPVLSFMRAESLVDDLLYIISASHYRFSPVVVVQNAKLAQDTLRLLKQSGALKPDAALKADPIDGRYVIDLTQMLKWER